ncbi:MAG TPA: hypothetical protein VH593_16490, partial [Ktedonobacteraceae bacterium]
MIRYGLQWQALQDYLAIEETANSSVWGENAGGTPPDNHVFIYAKDKSGTSGLFLKNDAGTEFDLTTMVGGSGASGRVAFWSGTSTISSNAAFLWDNTNKRLGVNVSSNSLSFEVECESTTDGPQYTRYGASGGALWTMRGATNTQASPGQITADLFLGGIGGQGRDNASNWSANVAVIAFKASQAFTSSARGTYITLETTTNGATTRAEKVRLDNAGVLLVGGGATQTGASAPGIEVHPLSGSGGSSVVWTMGFGSGNVGNFQGRSARGTSGSPTASQSDDAIARFSAVGYGATAYAASFRAAITHYAAENWTDSAQGTYTELATTPTGSTTAAVRFRIGPAGQWGIGGATYGSSGNLFKSGGSGAAPSWQDHTADFLTQYVLLAGRSGGQTVKGDTASGGSLTLMSTNHATKGKLLFGTSAYDEVNNALLIGETTRKYSSARFEIHTGTDLNCAFSTGITDTTGIALQAFNDAVGANIPLEFRGTKYIFSNGACQMDDGSNNAKNRFRHLNMMCKTKRTTDKTISNATWTLVDWDSEFFDTHSMHDTVTNNSRVLAPIAGKYAYCCTMAWTANAAGFRFVAVEKNAGGTEGGGTRLFPQFNMPDPLGAQGD